jgi:hypothetical protein
MSARNSLSGWTRSKAPGERIFSSQSWVRVTRARRQTSTTNLEVERPVFGILNESIRLDHIHYRHRHHVYSVSTKKKRGCGTSQQRQRDTSGDLVLQWEP